MRVAILGASGMLGQALRREFESHHETYPLDSTQADITSIESLRGALEDARPRWIVNAAAFTDVDGAEKNRERAFLVNVTGSKNLADVAHDLGAGLLSFSSDYVFDGECSRPYKEWDPPNPINEYGRTKWLGERMIRGGCPRHLILRTSWLYGPGGNHFVDKIVARAGTKEEIEVVDDQRGTPTFTVDLAVQARSLVESGCLGTYHVTNGGDCTWFEFAEFIIGVLGLNTSVLPVSSDSVPTPARRPANSVLDNCALRAEGSDLLRPWREAAASFLED